MPTFGFHMGARWACSFTCNCAAASAPPAARKPLRVLVMTRPDSISDSTVTVAQRRGRVYANRATRRNKNRKRRYQQYEAHSNRDRHAIRRLHAIKQRPDE